MTITSMSDPSTMTGAPVRGSDGEKLGKIDAIYYDNDTDAERPVRARHPGAAGTGQLER